MRTRYKIALAVGLVVLTALLLRACPPLVYFGEAISGRVVDAETKQPVAGAVIVATWCMITVGWGHTGPPWLLRSAETLSDKDGNYALPAWGPRLHPPWAWLDGYDPGLYFFKAGYKPLYRSNQHISSALMSRSDWSGATIELEPFRGTAAERLIQLDHALPICGLGRSHMPVKLCDEILKERTLFGREDPPFFDNIERLRQGR